MEEPKVKNDIIMPTAIDFLYDIFNVSLQFIRGTWKDHLRILNLERHDIIEQRLIQHSAEGLLPSVLNSTGIH